IRLHDVASGKIIRSLPIGKNSYVDGAAFSKSGKIIATSEYVVPDRQKWKERSARLRFWDADAGTELASFAMDEKESDIVSLEFSPDGHTVGALLSKERRSKLLLFDASQQKLANTVVLCDEKAITRTPVFSPDGRWIAVATQVFPEESERDREPSAE